MISSSALAEIEFVSLLVQLAFSLWLSLDPTRCLRILTRGVYPFSGRAALIWKILGVVNAVGTALALVGWEGLASVFYALPVAIAILSIFVGKAQSFEPPPPPAQAHFEEAWQVYRRLRWINLLLFIGYLPVMTAALFAFSLIPELDSMTPVYVFAAGWILAWAYASWRWAFWPCPRCGKAFFAQWRGPFARRCAYCKLPKWANSPEA